MKGLFRDTDLVDRLRHQATQFILLQRRDDCSSEKRFHFIWLALFESGSESAAKLTASAGVFRHIRSAKAASQAAKKSMKHSVRIVFNL